MSIDRGAPRQVIAVALAEFGVHDARPLELLKASGAELRMNRSGHRPDREELVELARDAVGIIAGLEPYDGRTLPRLPLLRCISRCGVGVDNIDLDLAMQRGVTVLNTPVSPTDAVAELAVGMVIALLRDLVRQHLLMRAREWRRTETHLLRDRRVTVVGLGRIGRRTVELLRPFGPDLMGVDPAADRSWCDSHGVLLGEITEGLRHAEVLIIVAAKDPRSPMRIGRHELAMLPPRAILVNVARGGLVDEEALASALRSGQLAGAGLDVYEDEPYSGPLCDVDGVILTPHAATSSVEARVAMELECIDKMLRFMRDDLRDGEAVVPIQR